MLQFEIAGAHTASINARRRAGFEAFRGEAERVELFAEQHGRRLTGAPAADLRAGTDVHLAASECTGGEYDGACAEAPALDRFHAGHARTAPIE